MAEVIIIAAPEEGTRMIVITDSEEATATVMQQYSESILETYTSDDVQVIVDGENL